MDIIWGPPSGNASTDRWSCAGCGKEVKFKEFREISKLIVTCFILCPECAEKQKENKPT